MTRATLVPTLRARTVLATDSEPGTGTPLDVLLARATPDSFIWVRDGYGFVTSGVAATVPAAAADDLLATIPRDDDLTGPGTGAIAVGALTFLDAAASHLVVPRRVDGWDADGRRWRTQIAADLGVTRPDATRPGVADPGRGVDRDRTPAAAPPATRTEWAGAVAAALARIAVGELTKVVLARSVLVTADQPLEPARILHRLAAREPHRYLFATPDIVGASPELLVERFGADVRACPLAGSSRSADAAAVAALSHSDKDRHEHEIVVESVAGTLAAHCDDLAVGATATLGLADLAHLATPIRATARASTPSALGLALALHPTPAVAGSPTPAALDFIAGHEPDRGRYAGPVGWVGADGDGQFAVALRCAQLLGPDARQALLHAGAGIVAGSTPDAEWDEIDTKLTPMIRALPAG